MKGAISWRLGIAIIGSALLVVKSMTFGTEESEEEIENRIEINQELTNQFYTKNYLNEVIIDMKDSVNTIWIITASVHIIGM